jgi:hypothetical protein
MPSELLSTTRPTTTRLLGFLCLAAGAVLAGIGATREWAAIGFPGDLEHAADAPLHGTDVWEGKVVLLGAALALVAMLAMRLTRSSGVRRALAVCLIAIGVAITAIAGVSALRAEDRFGEASGADRYATWLAAQLGLPEDVVREQFDRELEAALRVDVEPGVWLSVAGGVLLVVGGALSLAWVRQREAGSAVDAD